MCSIAGPVRTPAGRTACEAAPTVPHTGVSASGTPDPRDGTGRPQARVPSGKPEAARRSSLREHRPSR